MAHELTVAQRQQYALLLRKDPDMAPADARALAVELQPETKSAYPAAEGSPPTALPGRFGLSNWPSNWLDNEVYPIGPLGAARRALTPKSDAFAMADNSAVLASINTLATACMEAPLVVKRESEEEGGQLRLEIVRSHQIYPLLKRPNRVDVKEPDSKVFMSLREIAWLREYCLHVDGNFYLQIVRLGDPRFGLPAMLIPVMPFMMEPVTVFNKDGTPREFISYYAYAPSKEYVSNPLKVSTANVLHFRYGRDPNDLRKGLGLVKRLHREVYRDDIATHYTNTLLKNGAVPGLVVTPEEGTIEEDEAREAKAALRAAFSGDEMGSIAIMSRGADVKQFGFNPEEMNLGTFHKHAEERVAAVLNVPAMVAQLGAGLEQAAQFSNFHEAREMMAENSVLPRFLAADEVYAELMREFTNDESLRLVHDTDQIRALQTDVTQRFERLQIAVGGGWMTANESRAQVGLPPISEKTQQVPLTQGEDNRLNLMLQQGLLTVNEARATVGLDPIDGGDALTNEFGANAVVTDPNALPPPTTENTPPNSAKNPVTQQPGNPGNPKNVNQAPGNTQVRTGRQGANLGTKGAERAIALQRLFESNDPDLLFAEWQKLREDGLSLVDVALPPLPDLE